MDVDVNADLDELEVDDPGLMGTVLTEDGLEEVGPMVPEATFPSSRKYA